MIFPKAFKPHTYQATAIQHLLANPFATLFLDPGLGKTAITLTAARILLDRADVSGVLVVAPLRVCEMTWPAEVAKWRHTRRRLALAKVLGSQREREAALASVADIYVINYENLIWLCEWIEGDPKARLPFDMLVLDESTKMKAPDARRFRRLKPHLGRFCRRYILTGTPTPNGLGDLWAPIYCLDRGQRLLPFVTHFRNKWFTQDYTGFKWDLKPGAAEAITTAIQDVSLVLRASDHLAMPTLTVNRLALAIPRMDIYKVFEKEMFHALEDGETSAVNQAVLNGKLRQWASGAIYHDIPEGVPQVGPRTWEVVNATKLDALDDLLDELGGKPVLVCYEFKHELARLLKRYPQAVALAGKDTAKLASKWNAGKIPVLLCHPASVGHGLNLQDGGSTIIWLTLPWSLELYDQMVARLWRQGQQHPVVVHHLVAAGTVEVSVSAALQAKADVQEAVLERLKNTTLQATP
jgi:SNF2 family DNA or RNA helicase